MSSKSKSSQSSTQQDQRVGLEGDGLAVGSGATVQIDASSTFDENALAAFEALGEFADKAIDTVAISTKAAVDALSQTKQLSETGKTADSINPAIPSLAVVAIAVSALFIFGRK